MKKILMIGSGGRVRSTTLPVLERLSRCYSIQKVFSKDSDALEFKGAKIEPADMDLFSGSDLDGVDLVYVAVTKPNFPRVLKTLCAHDVSGIDLLIETPALLFKHFCHAGFFQRFKNAWAAEDCIALPCFDFLYMETLRCVPGDPEHVEFHHSAYKYHSIATLKTLLRCSRITSARRKKTDKAKGTVCRSFTLSNNRTGRVHEPRDYSRGSFVLSGGNWDVTDASHAGGEDGGLLEPVVADGSCKGFRIGDAAWDLNEDETALMGGVKSGSSVTSMMDEMKRVGLFRMLVRIHDGKGGYPLEEALDDMVIDYYLDRLGFYSSNPLMSVKSVMGRMLLKGLTGIIPG